jgi:hypothetical protein
MGIIQLKDVPCGDEKKAFSNATILPMLWQKKSPSGA